MRKYLLILTILIFITQCKGQNKTEKSSNQIVKIIDFFIKEENISPKNIILVRLSFFPNETNYLTELYDFNPNMTLGKNDNDKDFGQYKYKKYTISFEAENGIDISPILKNKELTKLSDKSFRNNNEIDINYDPVSLKFYVNKNFKFIKPFHNWSGKQELDEKIKNYLLVK